jgi:cytochrome c-type biogenesis protein CcmE
LNNELDLSPRDSDPHPRVSGRRSLRNKIIGGVIGAVLIFVLFQGLTDARVFFLNVDEAIEQKSELGERTFRMQGTVISEEGSSANGALLFTVAYNDATAKIQHVGPEPSDLFDLGEPVVVEGHWNGDLFESNQIIVKHDESYVEDNPARVEYELDPS